MFFSGSPVALFHACLQIFWYMCQEFVSCIPCHYKQRISHKAYVYSAKRYNTQFFFCCVCTFPSSTTQLTAAANVCAGVAFQDAEVLERARARHARAPPRQVQGGVRWPGRWHMPRLSCQHLCRVGRNQARRLFTVCDVFRRQVPGGL